MAVQNTTTANESVKCKNTNSVLPFLHASPWLPIADILSITITKARANFVTPRPEWLKTKTEKFKNTKSDMIIRAQNEHFDLIS